MIPDIAILIVLYKDLPQEYIYTNTNINIIIVDNTPERHLSIDYTHITYIPLNDNMGIAEALNVGFRKAKELGVKWVITMDQDSILPDDMIEKYLNFIKEHSQEKIGILSPLIMMYDGEKLTPKDSYDEIEEAITSGCMVNIKSFDEAQGFKSEMFIDGVDFEYCYNIKQYGYKIFRLNNVLMQHHLGNTKEYKLFGKHLFYVTNHNYIRRYYMTRNSLYIKQLYFADSKPNIIKSLIPYVKILLFENDKLRKFKYIRLAKKDFKCGKLGKIEHNI